MFLLPEEIQHKLQVNVTVFNPLTFITAMFVHGNPEHLVSNVSVYFLVGYLSYFLNNRANRDKFFLASLLMFLFVLPLVYYPFLLFLNLQFLHLQFVSRGLSLMVSGLIGFVIPSLIIFLKQIPDLKINYLRFFLSIVFLTGSLMAFSYLMSSLYNMVVFFTLIVIGFLVGVKEVSQILRFGHGNKKNTRMVLTSFLILLVYFILLPFLFPTNIVQSSGEIVDIIAHYFGVFFGLLLPYLIGMHNYSG